MNGLVSFLDASTPFVQGFDFVLMLFCAFYCFRSARRSPSSAVTLLAFSCLFSAAILLGLFVSAIYQNHPLLPLKVQVRQIAYVTARLLAPFELLLFAIAIILVAGRNMRPPGQGS